MARHAGVTLQLWLHTWMDAWKPTVLPTPRLKSCRSSALSNGRSTSYTIAAALPAANDRPSTVPPACVSRKPHTTVGEQGG